MTGPGHLRIFEIFGETGWLLNQLQVRRAEPDFDLRAARLAAPTVHARSSARSHGAPPACRGAGIFDCSGTQPGNDVAMMGRRYVRIFEIFGENHGFLYRSVVIGPARRTLF